MRINLLWLLLLIGGVSFGQNSSVISGKISDEKKEGVPGVTVELRRETDSVLIKVTITDIQGNYSLEGIRAGRYFIKASLIGFTSYRSKTFDFEGSNKTLAEVSLNTSAVELKAAEVSAIRPLIEVKADKTIFNIENTINTTGNTAYELLQKAPGVMVDNNDNIMLKGRGGVMVQIDGRNTQMSQQDLADYLKSIQSTDVESIELISNPSAKYDAQGTAGIINIKLKKNKNFGTNGSFTAGYGIGVYSKYNTALSINNRSKKMSVFSTYSNNWGDRKNEFYLYREQFPFTFNSGSINRRWGLGHNYKAGIDYTLNSKHGIGIMVNGNYNNLHSANSNRNSISHFNALSTDSILQSDQTMNGFTNNINVNLNHHFKDTTGHDLTTDLDIGFYDSDRNNYQPNVYKLPDDRTVLSEYYYRSVTPTTINIFTLKSDYSQNLLKGKLGAGYKVSLVKTDNTFNFYNIFGSNEILDNTRSNRFEYTEQVIATYLNYQYTLGKFDLQAGVRMENTDSEGDLKSATDTVQNRNVKRNYTNFFPSGGITYNLNQTNAFAFVYSRRIDRPNYQELNPFEWKLDELSYMKGNPFLNPQYSDKYELSHTYKYATTTSIGYSRTTDFFAQINDTLTNGRTAMSPRNLATEKVLNINLSSSQQINKWYSVYINAGVYNQKYNADFGNNKTINTSVTYFNLYGQNTIKLPRDFTLEISGWYNSSGVWGGSFVNSSQGSLDLGLQKKFLGDQATLRFSFTDILYTAPWSGYNVYGGLVIRVNGNWESQQFRAAFTWRFGNKQMKNVRARQSGSESEMKRIGGE